MVGRNLEYQWNSDWVPTPKGFKYVSVDSTLEAPSGQTLPQPGLNGLTVPAYAWYYSVTGDTKYRDMVDVQLQGLADADRKWWEASGKAFDQAFDRMFNTLTWRTP
jgi:hypothetical protein